MFSSHRILLERQAICIQAVTALVDGLVEAEILIRTLLSRSTKYLHPSIEKFGASVFWSSGFD